MALPAPRWLFPLRERAATPKCTPRPQAKICASSVASMSLLRCTDVHLRERICIPNRSILVREDEGAWGEHSSGTASLLTSDVSATCLTISGSLGYCRRAQPSAWTAAQRGCLVNFHPRSPFTWIVVPPQGMTALSYCPPRM